MKPHEKGLKRVFHSFRYAAMGIYLVGTIVFFVMFFPYASGYVTPTAWLDAMKWFSRLYY